ncbi:MAG: hypothetical protein ACHP8A_19880 [Terriglobales bacterium]|jgi:hypothetical protein
MQTLRIIWLLTIVLSVGVQIIMLSLQAGALRRFGHRSFWLLGGGSLCLLVYGTLGAAPYFVTFSESALTELLSIGLAFASVGAIFAVWGTASLFRRFGQLQRASINLSGEAA